MYTLNDVTVCCVSDARPEWVPFLWKQFTNMGGRRLVVVSARDNFEPFVKLLKKRGPGIAGVIRLPEKAVGFPALKPYVPGEEVTVIIDCTLPPVSSKAITLGAKRNHALSLAETEFVTWMDDDDLAHKLRLEVPLSVLNEHPEADFVLMDESCPLLHVELLKAQPEERRAYNWAAGLFRRTKHPAFPPFNLSEDYFMMQHVLNVKEFRPETVVKATSEHELTVHLAHGENTSVSGLSLDEKYWPIDPVPAWVGGGDGWTGLHLAPRCSRTAP